LIYRHPYSPEELAETSPAQRPAQGWRRRWTVVSLLFGLAGGAVAFSCIGPIGVVVGGIGIAAGALALLRARPAAADRVLAMAGTVISALVVAVALLMALAAHLPSARNDVAATPTAEISTDVDAVLADELGVRFGGFTASRLFPEVTVTLTNKLSVVRQCDIKVGAFAAPREQIASARVEQKSSRYDGTVLDAHATVEASAEFLMGGDDTSKKRLTTATFRVITVACGPFDYSHR
jgi:fumarate reductase subunit D